MGKSPLVQYQPKLDDAALAEKAAYHLANHGSLQVVANFIKTLRRVDLPELKAPKRRELLTATERMTALEARPDIRQRIVTKLTGTLPKIARNRMSLEMQITLLDDALGEEVCTADDFDQAFEPEELAVHVGGELILNRCWDTFNWEDDTDERRDVLASYIESLLAWPEPQPMNGPDPELEPILVPWDVLGAIDPVSLLNPKHFPMELQVALFRSWHTKTKPGGEIWDAKDYIKVATVREIVKYIPLVELHGVVELSLERMGFIDIKPIEIEDEDEGAAAEDGSSPKG